VTVSISRAVIRLVGLPCALGSNQSIAWQINGTEFGDLASAIYIAYNGWSGHRNLHRAVAGGKR
jgi:hypothetical protein